MTQPLWAPWRMDYIEGPKPEGCILCDKPRERRDPANLILYRGGEGFIMLNAFPYNNGHLLVSPYEHVPTTEKLSERALLELFALLHYGLAALHAAYRPEGFNIGINLGKVAGAGIEGHVHLHIVPRWAGDSSFMASLAETRVIPEHLRATYDRLAPHFPQPDTRRGV